MYTILHKEKLTSNELYLMEIKSPWIAESGKPGQFVIVIPDAKGERVPLTICDIDKEKKSVTIVYQVVGDSTRKLAEMNEGDAVFTIVGPLGRPSELLEVPENERKNLHVLFVAGGVGTAPVYPQAKWLHAHGAKVDVIIGAKTASLLIYKEEMAAVCDHLHLCTDDGSAGFHGVGTACLENR